MSATQDTKQKAKRPPGRPRKATAADGRILTADTIEAAAGATGHSERFLALLKAKGCPAFRSGRIHLGDLRSWIEEHPAEASSLERQCAEIDELDAGIKRERLRKLQIENDESEGRLMPRAEIRAQARDLAESQLGTLRNWLEEILPKRLAGQTATEAAIRAIGYEILTGICRDTQRHADRWTK
jgi:hypothetical protein